MATEAAFPIHDYASFDAVLSNLLDDPQLLSTSGESARKLVLDNIGATEQILDLLKKTGFHRIEILEKTTDDDTTDDDFCHFSLFRSINQ